MTQDSQVQAEREIASEENIGDSIQKLQSLQEEVEELREQRLEEISESEVPRDEKEISTYRRGTIVPLPDDEDGPNTGELENGSLVVWVRDEETREVEKKTVDFPNNPDNYSTKNEFMRLCSVAGVSYRNPEEILYESVPVKEYGGHSSSFTLHLPEDAKPTSRFKHRLSRKTKGVKQNLSEGYEQFKAASGVFMLPVIMYFLLTDWPVAIPTSGEQAQAMGIPKGVGFIMFMIASLVLLGFTMLCTYLIFRYTLPVVKQSWDEYSERLVNWFNSLIDDEYTVLED